MNEMGSTTIVEKDTHRGSWDALWAAGGFAAGWFAGRNGNCNGNCNNCNNGCGCNGGGYGPYGAAAATAIYQQGIMEGKNTAGIDYIAQSNSMTAQEMRNGFAQMNAQFTNILDREYQKVLAENASLKSNNALCAAMSPLTNSITSLTGTVNCIRDAFTPGYVRSVPLCPSKCNCNSTVN
jgi:hypothetical protein